MDWPADIRPSALRQPDGYSCGATTVVAARVLLEPGYRPADTKAEILGTHRRLTSATDSTGRAQLPWPRGLGTPPWAVARAISALTGEKVRTRLARLDPGAAYDELVRRVATRPAAAYIGNTWLPRHVVLVVAPVEGTDEVRVFDPAHGELVTVPRACWDRHEVGVAGWSHFWFVV
jgi:hypothetical protein